MSIKITRTAANKSITGSWRHIIIFTLVFAIIGSILLFISSQAQEIPYAQNPPHAAECIENTPGKTTVSPGERFTARIRIKNIGSSTFSPAFGVGLLQYPQDSNFWNASGKDLDRNYAPGEIATFNLSLTAPNTTGTYSFNWGVAIAFQGYLRNPCTGRSITIIKPPSPVPPSKPPTATPKPKPQPISNPSPPKTTISRPSSNLNTTSPTRTETSNTSLSQVKLPIPTNFQASLDDSTGITLQWDSAENNSGYQLDRSTDKKDWQAIGPETVSNSPYTDVEFKYETTYYYRIRSVDSNGGKSDYAYTEITTGKFSSNLNTDGLTLKSDDGLVSVYIPASAIDTSVNCNLDKNVYLSPPVMNDYVNYTPVYEVLCKTANGTFINTFNTPIQITITLQKSYKNYKYLTYNNDWQDLPVEASKSQANFSIKDTTTFIVVAQIKSTPLYLKIVIGLLIGGLVIFGILIILNVIARLKIRHDLQKKAEDYYRKEHGY